jgi:hypothetical protein
MKKVAGYKLCKQDLKCAEFALMNVDLEKVDGD